MMETAVAANTLCLKVRLLPRGLQMPAQSTATRTPCDFGRRYAASGISCLRQVFSNPKLLAKREPVQVCKMEQEWFVARLAVPDKSVRDRLLYETVKPILSG